MTADEIQVMYGRQAKKIDCTTEQAREMMTRAKFRVEVDPVAPETRVLMDVDGETYMVGRTDLMDDVSTWIGATSDKTVNDDPVAYYKKGVVYGARVIRREGRLPFFAVIDSMSDG